MSRRIVIYLSVVACLALVSISASPVAGEIALEDMLPALPDRNPVTHVYPDENQSKVMDFISNTISDEAGSLAPFWAKMQRLRSGSNEVVSIIHLGDSHVQAGFWDARLRELLQSEFGNAGRGMIVPHKLSGSNEPRDYSILTQEKYVCGRATSRDLVETLWSSGVAVGLDAASPMLKIWSKEPFNSVTVFHHPKAPFFSPPDSLFIGSYCTMANTMRSTRVALPAEVDSLSLRATISADYNNPTIYGFSLENGHPGVLLHSMGVNGAAFEHIGRNTDFSTGGAHELAPDLIIISLGTNNCFGNNYRSHAFREVAESFISNVRNNYPGSALLITTPMEGCSRSRRTYPVNKNLANVAETLEEIARELGVACWNFYDAAGGDGSSSVWHGRKLMQGDRLHLTEEGYTLQGDMLYDAMMRSYSTFVCPDEAGAGSSNNPASPQNEVYE